MGDHSRTRCPRPQICCLSQSCAHPPTFVRSLPGVCAQSRQGRSAMKSWCQRVGRSRIRASPSQPYASSGYQPPAAQVSAQGDGLSVPSRLPGRVRKGGSVQAHTSWSCTFRGAATRRRCDGWKDGGLVTAPVNQPGFWEWSGFPVTECSWLARRPCDSTANGHRRGCQGQGRV